MEIKFKLNKKDAETLLENNIDIDWKLLSYATTTAYNWAKPNRRKDVCNIYVKLNTSDPNLAGWYNYGSSLYINLNNCSSKDEFISTVFHEFRHWVQYIIENRPAHSMVSKRKHGWDQDNAEEEAEKWEEIGSKIVEIYEILSYIKEHEYNYRDNKK